MKLQDLFDCLPAVRPGCTGNHGQPLHSLPNNGLNLDTCTGISEIYGPRDLFPWCSLLHLVHVGIYYPNGGGRNVSA